MIPGYSVEVGVMPNETIICNDGSKLTVQWGKAQPAGCGSTETPEDPSVIMTSLKAWEDPDGACGGWDVVEAWHLDAATINRLLPILQRACNQAYGTNLVETTTMYMVSCTCGVVSGGARDPQQFCPMHTRPPRGTVWKLNTPNGQITIC